MADRVVLEVNNKNYWGWNKMSSNRSMEAISGSFSIDLVDQVGSDVRDLNPGDSCRVYLEDDNGVQTPILSGFIETLRRNKTGSSSSLGITGRDITADLVDCSAIVSSNTWTQATIQQIISDLIAPFNINLIDETGISTKLKKITVQSGETCFAIIDRVCRQVGVLPLTDREGNLVLTYATETSTGQVPQLILGENILEIEESIDHKARFSQYIVKGQDSSEGSPWSEVTTVSLKGTAKDDNISRYRALVIMAEGKSTQISVRQRAAWEAQVRAGRSTTYLVKIRGWFRRQGATENKIPWEVNTFVDLTATSMGIQERLIIATVDFTLDAGGGRFTTLTLRDPRTYRKNPSPEVPT